MANLFNTGHFALHSGTTSSFRIDCDALTDTDIETIAYLLAKRLPKFRRVYGVPTGGLRLAEKMKVYETAEPRDTLLLVDDVLTTGQSLEEFRGGREVIGAVIFSRALVCPDWIYPLFTLHP